MGVGSEASEGSCAEDIVIVGGDAEGERIEGFA